MNILNDDNDEEIPHALRNRSYHERGRRERARRCRRDPQLHRPTRPVRALIERAQAMPRQGSSSGFKYGRAVGAIEATVALCSIPMEIVEPSAWKRFWHLPGKDKEAARQKAVQLFPGAHAVLARKRDHGRSEAMLVALYGAYSNGTCTRSCR